jgi:HSP20 family molecular chaperone IbpA
MPNVGIQKVEKSEQNYAPVFQEMEKRIETIRAKAWESFEKRGFELGHDLDDWFKAEREILGWPAAEMADRGENYELQVTLPGFDAKEVEVTVSPAEIIVHAAAKREEKGERGNVVWSEFGSNDLFRRFEMPKDIDINKATANLDNGILKITAAKLAQPTTQPTAIVRTAAA